MAACTSKTVTGVLQNCMDGERKRRESIDVTADSLIADHANNVNEEFRKGIYQGEDIEEESGYIEA